jgi:hypothetical protein
MVRRTVLALILVAALTLAAAGCGTTELPPVSAATREPEATSGSTPTPTPTAGPTAAAERPGSDRLTATGIAPYLVGTALDALTAAGALTNIKESTTCPGYTTADALGALHGLVRIAFSKGSLVWITVTSSAISTMEGAQIGMAFQEVEGLYSGRAVGLTNPAAYAALGVRGEPNSGTGQIFVRSPDSDVVNIIEAGRYDLLESNFVNAKGC